MSWGSEGVLCGCHPKAVLFSAATAELISVSVHIVYTLNLAFHHLRYGWLGWLIPWCLSGGCSCLLLRCRLSRAPGDCVPFLVWIPVRLFSHLLCLSLAWLQTTDFSLPLPAHASLLLQSLAFLFYATGSVASLHSVWAIHDLLRDAIYGPPPLPPPNRRPNSNIQFTVDIPPRHPPPPPPKDPIYEQWNRLASTLKNWRSQPNRAATKPLPPPPLPPTPPPNFPPPLPPNTPPPPPPRPSLHSSRTTSQEYL